MIEILNKVCCNSRYIGTVSGPIQLGDVNTGGDNRKGFWVSVQG